MERVWVGSVEIIALPDAMQSYPAERVFPDAGDALDEVRDFLTADGEVMVNFGCFLLRADGQTVLVDTVLGPESQGALLGELASAGVATDAVDRVIFTHLHGDHTGWNLDRESGKPVFGNARYLVPQKDWDHYGERGEPPASFVRDVRPLEALGCLELFDGAHTLSASLTALPTPGHTPGHTSIEIVSDGEHGFILGDAVITPIDAARPEWRNGWDGEHEVAVTTRTEVMGRLAERSALVGASHMPPPGLGRFEADGDGFAWRPHSAER